MRKLTKKEMTQELRPRRLLPVYDVVLQRYYGDQIRVTRTISADNEIEAARVVREGKPSIEQIYSITLREDLKVWA